MACLFAGPRELTHVTMLAMVLSKRPDSAGSLQISDIHRVGKQAGECKENLPFGNFLLTGVYAVLCNLANTIIKGTTD